jgi:hypothetical protein
MPKGMDKIGPQIPLQRMSMRLVEDDNKELCPLRMSMRLIREMSSMTIIPENVSGLVRNET